METETATGRHRYIYRHRRIHRRTPIKTDKHTPVLADTRPAVRNKNNLVLYSAKAGEADNREYNEIARGTIREDVKRDGETGVSQK